MEVAFTEGKRDIMTFLYVLSLVIIGFTFTFGTVILPGKPAPLICIWKGCDGYEWRNEWTPGIPSGSCVNQQRQRHPVYVDRQYSWRKWCPSPIYCLPTEQQRKKSTRPVYISMLIFPLFTTDSLKTIEC